MQELQSIQSDLVPPTVTPEEWVILMLMSNR